MKLRMSMILVGMALAGFAPPLIAGPHENTKIVVHLAAPTGKNPCGRAEAHPPCGSIVSKGGLAPNSYFAYVLAVDADATAGVAGMQFGINYLAPDGVGVDIYDWVNCATLEFPSADWPNAGSGTLVTWDAALACQTNEPGGAGTGVVAVAGYFYCTSYTPDALLITPRPVDLTAKVASCSAEEEVIDSPTVHKVPHPLGFASFSVGAIVPGYNPCAGSSGSRPGADGVCSKCSNRSAYHSDAGWDVSPVPNLGVSHSV